MKYDVHFACGHTARIDLFGPTKDREGKIAWYEKNGECPDCYSKRVDARKASGCTPRTMHYSEYKYSWFWCATKQNSYDAEEKTLTVYIPDSYDGLEDLIRAMAKNSHEKSRQEAYEANAGIIKNALNEGRITNDQGKVLVDVVRKIRAH